MRGLTRSILALLVAFAANAGTPQANPAALSTTLTWQASARAVSYDLYLGPTNPPRLHTGGITSTSITVSNLAAATTYYWYVRAHSDCDAALTTDSATKSFTTAGSCGAAGSFALSTPANGDPAVTPTARLSWTSSEGAAAYDLYFGSGPSPSLYMSDVTATSVSISRLSPGSEYSWKVIAKAACDATRSTASEVRRFTIASGCVVPETPKIAYAPSAAVSTGATYSISWSESADLDAGGSYLVERAGDSAFASIIDQQQTTATSASFTSVREGTYYHRVRAIAGCDSSKRSASSDARSVSVSSKAAVVVFTVEPAAAITRLGDKLEDAKASFALENLSSAPVQLLMAVQLLAGSIPFFTIADPFGGDAAFFTLEPRQPKTFDIHFAGPPNDQAASYQGLIYVTSAGQPLQVTPQAYVNLKVGGDTNAAAPKILVGGVEADFACFPPFAGDDAARATLDIDLLNSGTTPMEVAAEIGPETWLKLEKDWNSTPIASNSFRTLRLSTQRTRAPSGSALPRYTYVTIRNKAGQSARILVEDSSIATVGVGRSAPLAAGERSMIVPFTQTGSGRMPLLHLTNTSADALPVELIYTPEGADGFDAARVKRITVAIPAGDVATLTNPLVQLFGITATENGAIEIRSASDRLGLLAVRAEQRASVTGGGAFAAAVPVVTRGEGARVGSAYQIAGIVSTADVSTSIVVTETTGREKTSVRATLVDSSGSKRGEQTFDLPRYGTKRFDDVAQSFGGASVSGARLTVEVTAGGGAVVATALVADRTNGSAAVLVSRPVTPEVRLSSLGRRAAAAATNTKVVVIPGIVTDVSTRTTLGIVAASAPVVAQLQYRDSSTGATTVQTVNVASGQTADYSNVVADLFHAPAGSGTVTISADSSFSAYAFTRGKSYVDALPAVSQAAEASTGGGSTKPVYADGLEQSTDASRGRTTSLLLAEISGQAATVSVRLYEPGNRTLPIAEKQVTVNANAETRYGDLFAALGLASDSEDLRQRRKNRVNAACVITPVSGNGVIVAEAVLTDNKTGDRKTILFTPAGGVPATSEQRQTTTATSPGRHRAVGH